MTPPTPQQIVDCDIMVTLSPRQYEVAGWLAAGLSNTEIAQEMMLAHGTVERHVEDIYDRVGQKGRGLIGALYASGKIVCK